MLAWSDIAIVASVVVVIIVIMTINIIVAIVVSVHLIVHCIRELLRRPAIGPRAVRRRNSQPEMFLFTFREVDQIASPQSP